jgi:hypothetical protein
MAEIRVTNGTGREKRRTRQRQGGTGIELVKVASCGLENGTGGEISSGRVTVLEPVKKTWRGNGLERLEKAADRRLGRESEELADLLLDKAKQGKVESARLLVALAEHRMKRKPQEKKKKKKREGPSWEELLGSEPEFVAPEEGDVWVGDGWKKPSGEFVKEYAQVGDDE